MTIQRASHQSVECSSAGDCIQVRSHQLAPKSENELPANER